MIFKASFARRRFLSTALVVGTALPLQKTAWGAQADTAQCKSNPEQEVGPYYLDDELLRSDITEGRAGVPLIFDIEMMDARRCVPLVDAIIDVWQCDALGVYSGFTKSVPPPEPPPDMWKGGPGGPGGQKPDGPPPKMAPSDHLTFLRGVQRTSRDGLVTFQTIVPGVYEGRTNHIHFKVRGTGSTRAASHVSHVGQIFFPETLMVQLMGLAPYRDHHIRRTTQNEDPVFSRQQGRTSIRRVALLFGNDITKGLRARIVVAVNPDATPMSVDN